MRQSIQGRIISNLFFKKFSLKILFTIDISLTFVATVHIQFVSN